MQDSVNVSRRAVLAGAAVMGAVVLAGGTVMVSYGEAKANESDESASVETDVQYGFLMRTSKCTGCEECVKACRRVNSTPADVPARRMVQQCVTKSKRVVHVSTACMHCAKPACAEVCPAGAISKGEGGVVRVDRNLCIGCKYCYQACPFGVPHYTSESMDKCDCCLEAGVALGETPACVQACNFRALSYGKLDDLMSGSSGRAHQVADPTNPSYLVL